MGIEIDIAWLSLLLFGSLEVLLALGLPMIINSPIPGQEERNADYLLEQGAALKAINAVTLEYRIHWLLDHPEQLAAMRERARRLGRPGAAVDVLQHVLG